MNYQDIIRYGNRIGELELDINIHQFLYEYENVKYLITMKSGEIISVYEIVKQV